jgi:hypothetical protein
MRGRLLVFTVLVGVALQVGAVDGERIIFMLFSNGTPGYTWGLGVSTDAVADDFEVSSGTHPANGSTVTIQDIGCDFPDGWDGGLQWWIYVDDGSGEPGTVAATGWAPSVDWSVGYDLCAGSDVRWLQVWFPYGEEVVLTPGTRYWFAIHLGSEWDAGSGYVYHVTDSTTPDWNTAVVQDKAGGPWDDFWGHDMAFTVTHDTSFSYTFCDGFESADTTMWSASTP